MPALRHEEDIHTGIAVQSESALHLPKVDTWVDGYD
jgi:hypothetical protein